MLLSTDLEKVKQETVPDAENRPWQQYLKFRGGVSRDMLQLLQSYRGIFQDEISMIKRSDRKDADIVIVMTDAVKTAETALEAADKLITRARNCLIKREQQEQARRSGEGFAIHSDVKAFHGHGD